MRAGSPASRPSHEPGSTRDQPARTAQVTQYQARSTVLTLQTSSPGIRLSAKQASLGGYSTSGPPLDDPFAVPIYLTSGPSMQDPTAPASWIRIWLDARHPLQLCSVRACTVIVAR